MWPVATICPTGAIVEPYTADASPLYLLSHHRTGGAIPEELRPLWEIVFMVAMTASLSARGIAIRNSLQKTISARVSRYTPELIELFARSEEQF